MKTIYVDILIVINLAVDYLLLFGTARLAGTQFIRKKSFLGALTGAVYSLVIFLDISRLFFALTKFAVSAIMVAVTFGKRKAPDFIRLLLLFYICGFLFSGFMMLVNSIVHADSFFIKGGIVYFEFSAIGIVLSGTAAFAEGFSEEENRKGFLLQKFFSMGNTPCSNVFWIPEIRFAIR